jgi:hypothetical protein
MRFNRPILLAIALFLTGSAATVAGPLFSANITNAVGQQNVPTPVTLTSIGTQGSASGSGIIVSSSYLAGSVQSSATAANVFAIDDLVHRQRSSDI